MHSMIRTAYLSTGHSVRNSQHDTHSLSLYRIFVGSYQTLRRSIGVHTCQSRTCCPIASAPRALRRLRPCGREEKHVSLLEWLLEERRKENDVDRKRGERRAERTRTRSRCLSAGQAEPSAVASSSI
eukprot:1952225-Rhodomonas_salina.2